MKNSNTPEIELIEIIKIIKKRFYVFIIILIPIMLLVNYYYDSRITPSYITRIGLIIGNPIGEDYEYDIYAVRSYENLMDTYSALAKTSIVAENAAKRLNNAIHPNVIQASIVAQPQKGTQFMYINLTWDNPQQIKGILTAISDAFIEEAKKIYPTVNINIIENIKDPYMIMPERKKYIMMGLAGGFVLSILIIFGIDFFDNTIKTEEDVEEFLETTVYTQIPNDKKNLGIITEKYLKNLNYGVVEAYRSLRTNIEFASASGIVRSLVITSSRPGEGKSTTAAMLAAVMAKAGKKTILIDCDLRKPMVHKIFNISNSLGLSNFLAVGSKLKDIIHKSEIENLYILTSGVIPSNPPELLTSVKMKGFVEVLKSYFDVIIFDTPPVGLVSDAQIIAQYADGTIFVVAAGETPKEEAAKSKKLIDSVNGRILGVALNKVKNITVYSRYNYYYGTVKQKGLKTFFRPSRHNTETSKI
ncbi:polysaccharide biosynthesis tyrosine autokinase [Clostridium thermarum]|uniref:polysaccharide biosynthesis tyrosine autokinase n=1 Tax=Clostridium thermarum TaxID=1716543 RepID=UPI001120830C|nr:polysaccharide biosynthesis tyrosine autokinase [Clostridium thermarum]